MSIDAIWQSLLDKDDRTSPEEYPDMALITQSEIVEIIERCAVECESTDELYRNSRARQHAYGKYFAERIRALKGSAITATARGGDDA